MGNLAKIKFTYRGLVGGKAGNKSANRFPALVITER